VSVHLPDSQLLSPDLDTQRIVANDRGHVVHARSTETTQPVSLWPPGEIVRDSAVHLSECMFQSTGSDLVRSEFGSNARCSV
jgi:hypothetical protein